MKNLLATVLDLRQMYQRAAEAYLNEPDERIGKRYLGFAEECFTFATELSRRITNA